MSASTDRPRNTAAPETLELGDLRLASRPYRALAQHQISVRALVDMTAEDLLAYPGLGEGSVHNIAACLGRFGLSLRLSPPKPEPERRQRAKERGATLRDRWFAGETLDQIAASLGISRERVRQLILLADPGAVVAHRALRKTARR